jgi:N utilization substance protein B
VNPNHLARRLALQALSCLDAQGDKAMDLILDFIQDSREGEQVVFLATKLFNDARRDRPECDRLLARHARHWELGRLALVDRNILRLAVHELRKARTPPKVAITEAIRLAREFSTAESPRFVNGVLDAIFREIGPGANHAPAEEHRETSRDAGDTWDEDIGGTE